ncbi:N-acetylglucosamine kinase [Brevibacillus humidisoli]|uniref:N-acetylglucosamine kinase n=1 Tax=Brevibacillus humidisoli TaxID=2895522 RepID=UPI001E64D593|nr:BadF/BadG/BcrA/BcrD ATPase family protein [Brevibacillus humidisoli]UFJ39377.1 N-acetylglucosamine kinase [Brevibacillus humidisoli]
MKRIQVPLLAVDGGGTKCLAAMVATDRRILGTGRAGSCNYQGIGTTAAARELTNAIRTAMATTAAEGTPSTEEADASPSTEGRVWEVECAVFGMAGLDTEYDRQVIVEMVKEVLAQLKIHVHHLIVENDGFAALLGATDGDAGILVIAGTGSIAYGINGQGITARAGGWGHRVGDEGSGYWIGKQMITAVLKAADGRGEPTRLTDRLLRYLGLSQVEELYNWTYGPSYSVEKVGELSPLVSQTAAEGDVVAARILTLAAEELAQAARAVIQQLSMHEQPFKMILQGGVLQNDQQVRRLVVENVRHFTPQVVVDTAKHDPISGVIAKGISYLNKREKAESDRGVEK